jgi:hypothetical protein
MAPMVSGLVLQKKRNDLEYAHSPVLDDEFPQDGTIAIFIYCSRNVTIFSISCFLAPAGNKL